MTESGISVTPEMMRFTPVEATRSRIEGIAAKAENPTEPLVEALRLTSEISVGRQAVKTKAITELGKMDKEVTGQILSRLKDLSGSMERIVNEPINLEQLRKMRLGEIDFRQANEIILRYLESESTRGQISSPLTNLTRAINKGNPDSIRAEAGKVVALCQNPDVIWTELVKQGVITPEYIDNFDQIARFVEIAEKLKVLEGYQKKTDNASLRAIKAKVLLPYLDQGVSPAMIEEIIEGKFDTGEEFVKGSLAMFAAYEEEVESGKPGLTFRQKAARTAVVLATAAIMSTSVPLPRQGVIEKEIPMILKEDLSPADLGMAGQEETGVASPAGEQGESGVSLAGTFKKQAGSQGLENTPRMDGIENFKEQAKIVEWELTGNNLAGYYRESTGEYFKHDYSGNFFWSRVRHATEVSPEENSPENKPVDIKITGNYQSVGKEISLPTNTGYVVAPESVQVIIDGVQVGPGHGLYNLYVDTTGNFFLQSRENQPKEGQVITISYGLRKDLKYLTVNTEDGENRLENGKWNLIPDVKSEKLIDIGKLPPRIRSKYLAIKQGVGTPLGKAAAVTDLIQQELVYSLNPHYSDYYQKAKDPTDFVNRIFKEQYVDCDVANTVVALLIRDLGLESRMVYGYGNSAGSFLNSGAKQLRASERHGWVEAYIDGKWMLFDGTPTKMDIKTREAMRAMGLPVELSGGGLEDALKEIVVDLKSVKLFTESHAGLVIPIIPAIYVYALARAKRRLGRIQSQTSDFKDDIEEYFKKKVILTSTQRRYWTTIGDFYDDVVAQQVNPPTAWHNLVLPLTRFYRGTLTKQEQRVTAGRETLNSLQGGQDLAGLGLEGLDPLRLFGEISGFTPEQMNAFIKGKNLNKLAGAIGSVIERQTGLASVSPSGESLGGVRSSLLKDYHLKGYEGTQYTDEPFVIIDKIRGCRDLDSFLDGLASGAYKVYRKEARKREKARKKDPRKRSPTEVKRAEKPPLTIGESEFKTALKEKELGPFIVLWNVVKAADNEF